jgi:hypothetical protein
VGAVADRLSLVAGTTPGSIEELEAVKAFLRVEHDADDTLITSLIQAGKNQADAYLNNPFQAIAGDGTLVNLAIPASVAGWCLTFVTRTYERRALGLNMHAVTGAGNVMWAPDGDYTLLHPYRLNPGL